MPCFSKAQHGCPPGLPSLDTQALLTEQLPQASFLQKAITLPQLQACPIKGEASRTQQRSHALPHSGRTAWGADLRPPFPKASQFYKYPSSLSKDGLPSLLSSYQLFIIPSSRPLIPGHGQVPPPPLLPLVHSKSGFPSVDPTGRADPVELPP